MSENKKPLTNQSNNPLHGLTFKEAYHNYLKTLGVGRLNVDKLNYDNILYAVAKEYKEIEISGLDNNNPECDMLLFEYGNYDWTGEGERFNVSIKRQLTFKCHDEPGYYGFTIYFDKSLINQNEEFSAWCNTKNEIDIWLTKIKESIGLQKVIGKPALKFEVSLEKPS